MEIKRLIFPLTIANFLVVGVLGGLLGAFIYYLKHKRQDVNSVEKNKGG